MVQVDKIRQIVERKRDQQNLSMRALAKRAGLGSHSQIIRLLNGKTAPTKNILTKLCDALECTREERVQIFHAAEFLLPDENEEEAYTAA